MITAIASIVASVATVVVAVLQRDRIARGARSMAKKFSKKPPPPPGSAGKISRDQF